MNVTGLAIKCLNMNATLLQKIHNFLKVRNFLNEYPITVTFTVQFHYMCYKRDFNEVLIILFLIKK